MQVGPPLVPDRQSPVPRQPRQGPLHHPPILSQALARLDSPPGNPDLDPAAMQKPAAAGEVIRLVGMELGGPFAPVSGWGADQRDRIDQGLKHHAVMSVSPGQQAGQRKAVPIGDQMSFRAWLAPIGGVRTDRGAPLLAGMLALSTQARDQSMRSAAPSRSSTA
jgi:hypothetical protein